MNSIQFSYQNENFTIIFSSFSKTVEILKCLQECLDIQKDLYQQSDLLQLQQYSGRIAAYNLSQPLVRQLQEKQIEIEDNQSAITQAMFTQKAENIPIIEQLLSQCYIMAMKKQQFEETLRKFTGNKQGTIFQVACEATKKVLTYDLAKQIQYIEAIQLEHESKQQLLQMIQIELNKYVTSIEEPIQKSIEDQTHNQDKFDEKQAKIEDGIKQQDNLVDINKFKSLPKNIVITQENEDQVKTVLKRLTPNQVTKMIFNDTYHIVQLQGEKGFKCDINKSLGFPLKQQLNNYQLEARNHKVAKFEFEQFTSQEDYDADFFNQLLERQNSYVMCQQQYQQPRIRFCAIENLWLLFLGSEKKDIKQLRSLKATITSQFYQVMFSRFQNVINKQLSVEYYAEQYQKKLVPFKESELHELLKCFQSETIILIKFLTLFAPAAKYLYFLIREIFIQNQQNILTVLPRLGNEQFVVFVEYLTTNFVLQIKIIQDVNNDNVLNLADQFLLYDFLNTYQEQKYVTYKLSSKDIKYCGLSWMKQKHLNKIIFE